jgi:hypothetical protein
MPAWILSAFMPGGSTGLVHGKRSVLHPTRAPAIDGIGLGPGTDQPLEPFTEAQARTILRILVPGCRRHNVVVTFQRN